MFVRQTGQERISKSLTYTPERSLLSSLKSRLARRRRQTSSSLAVFLDSSYTCTNSAGRVNRDYRLKAGWKKGITGGRTGWNEEKLQNIGVQVREMAGEGKMGRVKNRKRVEVYV